MKKNEAVVLEVDVSGAELAIEDVGEGIRALKTLAKDIGAEISMAFAPLQDSLNMTVASAFSVTRAITEATTALESFVLLLTQTQASDQFAQSIKDGFDSVLGVIGTIAGVVGTLLTAKVGAPIVAVVAAVMAAVSLIVAAIVEIVEHWDEISQAFTEFFTQTIPQLWNQFVAWISGVVNAVGEFLSSAKTAIGEFCADCWNNIVAVWGVVSSWFNDNAIQPVMSFFSGLWNSITAFASDAWTAIKNTFQAVGAWFYQNVVAPVAGFFSDMWEGFRQAAVNAWEGVKAVFSAVAGFFGKVFSEAWAGVVNVFSTAGNIFVNIKDAIVSVFKSVVNGLIKGINSIVAIPFNGINGALSMVKNIEIFGLQPFSGLKTISVPQIPYLAQGAVLPANKPFLAVVGDQKSGTNIEAPLSTIQEAVASVMDGQVSAMLSGFEALLAENRQLRAVVESIEVGDTVIGQAAQRYDRRRALARGGVL